MPTIAPTIADRLTADSGVEPLISDRIYPHYVRLADKQYPLAVFKVENVSTQLATDGPTGLVSADYVIAALATSNKGANQLADAIQTSLDGANWKDITNAVNVQGVFLKDDGRHEDVITDPNTEAVLAFSVELTFLVWFNAL